MSKTRVQPTKALFFCSAPCEKKAARICNQALDAIENEDIATVCKKFNQSGRGQWNALFIGLFSCAELIFAIYYLIEKNKQMAEINSKQYPDVFELLFIRMSQVFFSALFIHSVLHAPTGLKNTNRYRQTKNICHDWLKTRLENNEINQIANVPGEDIDNYLQLKFASF